MNNNTPINYIEFKSTDLETTKAFYSGVFGWTFTDYGDGYIAFTESGIEGGFELTQEPIVNGALVVLHHNDLKAIKEKIIAAGAKINIDIFSFPGGSRFHFIDPSGNELAVWCEE
ncbi:VOC family protein [uncultured Croceitalea sp.]|uniref:VOC family protein n=1 Tax=uncultured Croceitalea sp. TaxID=1798908 RepID=UPI00374F7541